MGPIKTQIEAVKMHLINKHSITSMEAIKTYGITRLAAKIHTLRREGMTIETQSIVHKNRFGNKGQHAKYILISNRGIL